MRTIAFAAALLCAWVGQAAASPLGAYAAALPLDEIHGASPGAWVEWVTAVGGHPVGPWVRLRVDGPAKDEPGTWIELWISDRPGSATQAFRLLVQQAADPAGWIRRIEGRMLGGEVRTLPRPEGGAGGGTAPPTGTWVLGSETAVQTHAGTLRGRSARLLGPEGITATAVFSERLPLLGLVRLELANGSGLELHAWGHAGRSAFPAP